MGTEFLQLVFLLLLLFDPLGNVVIFSTLLKSFPSNRRQLIILREGLIACATLVAFVFAGDWILKSLRLSTVALEITGGLMLFIIALRMVFPSSGQQMATSLDQEPMVVPLAIPLIAGPASLATVLLASRQTSQPGVMILAIFAASAINIAVLLFGERLAKMFGKTGMEAMERLMGLALTTMAVQMILTGIKNAFGIVGTIG